MFQCELHKDNAVFEEDLIKKLKEKQKRKRESSWLSFAPICQTCRGESKVSSAVNAAKYPTHKCVWKKKRKEKKERKYDAEIKTGR